MITTFAAREPMRFRRSRLRALLAVGTTTRRLSERRRKASHRARAACCSHQSSPVNAFQAHPRLLDPHSRRSISARTDPRGGARAGTAECPLEERQGCGVLAQRSQDDRTRGRARSDRRRSCLARALLTRALSRARGDTRGVFDRETPGLESRVSPVHVRYRGNPATDRMGPQRFSEPGRRFARTGCRLVAGDGVRRMG